MYGGVVWLPAPPTPSFPSKGPRSSNGGKRLRPQSELAVLRPFPEGHRNPVFPRSESGTHPEIYFEIDTSRYTPGDTHPAIHTRRYAPGDTHPRGHRFNRARQDHGCGGSRGDELSSATVDTGRSNSRRRHSRCTACTSLPTRRNRRRVARRSTSRRGDSRSSTGSPALRYWPRGLYAVPHGRVLVV